MKEQEPTKTNRTKYEYGGKIASTQHRCEKCKKLTLHGIYNIRENGINTGTEKVCTVCSEKEKNKFSLVDY